MNISIQRVLPLATLLIAASAQAQQQVVVHPETGNTYWLFTNPVSLAEAERVALVYDGNLLAIDDAAELNWVCETFGAYAATTWTGLIKPAAEWKWKSGRGGANHFWMEANEPQQANYLSVLEMRGTTGLRSMSSNANHPFLVEFDAHGFRYSYENPGNGRRYHIGSAQSRDAATSSLGNARNYISLAHLTSQAENDWAYQTLLNGLHGVDGFWISGTDVLREGVWGFDSIGDPATGFTNWIPGQPDNQAGVEHYATMPVGYDGMWNDLAENPAIYSNPPRMHGLYEERTRHLKAITVLRADIKRKSGPRSSVRIQGRVDQFELRNASLLSGLQITVGEQDLPNQRFQLNIPANEINTAGRRWTFKSMEGEKASFTYTPETGDFDFKASRVMLPTQATGNEKIRIRIFDHDLAFEFSPESGYRMGRTAALTAGLHLANYQYKASNGTKPDQVRMSGSIQRRHSAPVGTEELLYFSFHIGTTRYAATLDFSTITPTPTGNGAELRYDYIQGNTLAILMLNPETGAFSLQAMGLGATHDTELELEVYYGWEEFHTKVRLTGSPERSMKLR